MTASSRNSPRGLTLVEVLAATVLLALVAGTCASLVRDAAAALGANEAQGPALGDLARLTDFWLDPADEEQGGSPVRRWLVSGQDSVDIAWPGDSEGRQIDIRLLTPGDGPAAWIEFECQGTRVWRWADLARLRQEAGP